MPLTPALPGIGERFTIGRVLSQSWQAFVANRWRFLLIAVVVSTISIIQALSTSETDVYASQWSFFSALWISGAIQSFAIAPITLGILDPDGEMRSGMFGSLHSWTRALKIIFATCMLQTAAYWPMAALIGLSASMEPSLISYAVIVVNFVAVSTLLNLFFPIFLVEQCSLWISTLRSIDQVMPQFWRIAALNILYWLVYFGGSGTVMLVAHSFRAGDVEWVYYALWWPLMVLLVLATNIIPAVMYRLLRVEREGPDPRHVAGVFE